LTGSPDSQKKKSIAEMPPFRRPSIMKRVKEGSLNHYVNLDNAWLVVESSLVQVAAQGKTE
jgi:hypothetical protein